MDLGSTGGGQSINAGANIATLVQKTNGQLINLGGADVNGTLGLTNAELNTVTAGKLRIGDLQSGAITISAPIAPASASALNLARPVQVSVASQHDYR